MYGATNMVERNWLPYVDFSVQWTQISVNILITISFCFYLFIDNRNIWICFPPLILSTVVFHYNLMMLSRAHTATTVAKGYFLSKFAIVLLLHSILVLLCTMPARYIQYRMAVFLYVISSVCVFFLTSSLFSHFFPLSIGCFIYQYP